jgi:hypothetical protein
MNRQSSHSLRGQQRRAPLRMKDRAAIYTRRAPLLLLLILVMAMAGVGIFLVSQTLASGALSGGAQVDPNTQIGTSFGVITIEHVENIGGLTSNELGGMTHGIQSLVTQDKAQIQVSVTLTNRLGREVAYTPSQFAIVAATGSPPIEPDNSTLPAGQIRPDSSIEATLSFVVPRDGSQFWIEFREPSVAAPTLVNLGHVDLVQQGGENEHH